MLLAAITPVVLTFNEAANIGRTLQSVAWAQRVVVVDSGSRDDTRAIAETFANVSWYERTFDNHVAQWRFALEMTGIDTDFLLALDADMAVLNQLLPLFALAAKAVTMRAIGRGLLAAYLGDDPAGRVLAGTVQRGAVQSVEAVVFFTDLRGFTALADVTPGKELITLLDECFECMVAPVVQRGGEDAIRPLGRPTGRNTADRQRRHSGQGMRSDNVRGKFGR